MYTLIALGIFTLIWYLGVYMGTPKGQREPITPKLVVASSGRVIRVMFPIIGGFVLLCAVGTAVLHVMLHVSFYLGYVLIFAVGLVIYLVKNPR